MFFFQDFLLTEGPNKSLELIRLACLGKTLQRSMSMHRDEEPFAHGSIWYPRNPTDAQNGWTILKMFRNPTQICRPEEFFESLTSWGVLICIISMEILRNILVDLPGIQKKKGTSPKPIRYRLPYRLINPSYQVGCRASTRPSQGITIIHPPDSGDRTGQPLVRHQKTPGNLWMDFAWVQ